MTTNLEAYMANHQRICQRAELEFAESRKKNPKLTVPKTVAKYAAAVRLAIRRRDGIAAVYAVSACHIAMKVPLD